MKRLFVLLGAILIIGAQAQTTKPGRIVTTTRLVAVFSELESNLEKAVQERDANTLSQFLSDDFEVWNPTPPGQPIPREDWWKQAASEKLESFHVRQMAVRSIADDTSVASFVLSETVNQGAARIRDTFVVDVWKQYGGKWQLTDRYAAAVVPRKSSARTSDKPPTGKR